MSCRQIHQPRLALTEGWSLCYLKMPFNYTGSQALHGPLLTESTLRCLAGHKHSVDSGQRLIILRAEDNKVEVSSPNKLSLENKKPLLARLLSLPDHQAQSGRRVRKVCILMKLLPTSSTNSLIWAECVLICLCFTEERSLVSVRCGTEVTAALCV